MDRHRPGLAPRHRRMAECTAVHGPNISGRSALASAPLRTVGSLSLAENLPRKQLPRLTIRGCSPSARIHALSAGERRDFVLFVADAKKPETRMRRARRLLSR